MDDPSNPIWIAIVIQVFSPIAAWLRSKLRKPKVNVVVVCPHCGTENGLAKLRNFVCHRCRNNVLFFEDIESTRPIKGIKTYRCGNCDAENFEGVKYCIQCGVEHSCAP